MPDQLVYADGRLVHGPDNRLVLSSGSDCCCGLCPTAYKAIRCGASTHCTGVPEVAYICTNALCNDGGGYPVIAPDRPVLAANGVCWLVNFGTVYLTSELPANTPVLSGPFACRYNCDGCQLPGGHFGISPCPCNTGGGQFEGFIDCECYWAAIAQGIRCPVFPAPNGRCYQPGAFQIGEASGTRLCGARRGCCDCCPGCTRSLVTVGSWSCVFGGSIEGHQEEACCGSPGARDAPGFSVSGSASYELWDDSPEYGCVISRYDWTWNMAGNKVRGRLIHYARGICQQPLTVQQDDTVDFDPGCDTQRYVDFAFGLPNPTVANIIVGCSPPGSQQVVATSATKTLYTFTGLQTVTESGSHSTARWGVTITPGGNCRGGCEQQTLPPSASLIVPGSSGGCSGCGAAAKSIASEIVPWT